MIKKHVAAALIAMTLTGAPVYAQSIMDTFRQFKGTLRQLGGKPANTPDARAQVRARTPPVAGPAGIPGKDDGQMVPAAIVADDPSDSALEQTVPVPRRVIGFDVRGFKLGMSPREVGRIGDRLKFRRRWNGLFLTTGSFEVEATNVANFQLNRPAVATSKAQLKAVEAFDPDGNEVKLEFTLETDGPKLSDITYTARLNGMTKQQTVAALTTKYGPPTSTDLTVSWSNTRSHFDNSSPSLGAVIDGDHMTLFLRQSTDYRLGAKKQLTDRAQQIAAARGGGVRF